MVKQNTISITKKFLTFQELKESEKHWKVECKHMLIKKNVPIQQPDMQALHQANSNRPIFTCFTVNICLYHVLYRATAAHTLKKWSLKIKNVLTL